MMDVILQSVLFCCHVVVTSFPDTLAIYRPMLGKIGAAAAHILKFTRGWFLKDVSSDYGSD